MTEKHFTVDARAMLTWGRDSIKDHTTAVLELAKNSYDAGAKIVEVVILAASEEKSDRMIRISDDGCGMTAKQWPSEHECKVVLDQLSDVDVGPRVRHELQTLHQPFVALCPLLVPTSVSSFASSLTIPLLLKARKRERQHDCRRDRDV